MSSNANSAEIGANHNSWNKGRLIGPKPPLKLREAAQQKQVVWKRALAAYQRKWEQEYDREQAATKKNKRKKDERVANTHRHLGGRPPNST